MPIPSMPIPQYSQISSRPTLVNPLCDVPSRNRTVQEVLDYDFKKNKTTTTTTTRYTKQKKQNMREKNKKEKSQTLFHIQTKGTN